MVAEGVEAVHLAVVVDERDVSPAEVDVDPVAVVLEGGEVRNPNEGSLAVRRDWVRRRSQQSPRTRPESPARLVECRARRARQSDTRRDASLVVSALRQGASQSPRACAPSGSSRRGFRLVVRIDVFVLIIHQTRGA